MHVLVTGGAGYLGRHVCQQLDKCGHSIEILDSFARATPSDIVELEELLGKTLPVHPIDIWLESSSLKRLFRSRRFDAVIHLAGVKPGAPQELGVAQCCAIDVGGTMNLLASMEEAGCRQLVFCSTISVYGDREDGTLAWKETEWPDKARTPPSAYGAAKDAVERVLAALGDPWSIRVLRCPEIGGALPDGRLGDTDESSTISRFLASTHRHPITIRSRIPDTADGSVVRDYVHVVDAARAHALALADMGTSGLKQYNVGSGRGTSMWQLLLGLQRARGSSIPSKSEPSSAPPSRTGVRLSDARKLRLSTGWTPMYTLHDLCEHAIEHWNKRQSICKNDPATGTSLAAHQPVASPD